jgi:transcriptional regulator with XRE-family HTH domain
MEQQEPGAVTKLNAAVAAEIRAILARRGWKQSQLAERLGVHEMWVSRRLRGVNAISVDDLERIAAALGIKPANLLGLAEQAGTQMNSRFPSMAERPSTAFCCTHQTATREQAGRGTPLGGASSGTCCAPTDRRVKLQLFAYGNQR